MPLRGAPPASRRSHRARSRTARDDRETDRGLRPQQVPDAARRRGVFAAGLWALRRHAARRAPRPLGRSGHRVHELGRPEPEPDRRPGHLSDRLRADLRAEGQDGSRVFVLRVLVRLRDLPGSDGSLLGEKPRPRVLERPEGTASRSRQPEPRTGRDRRRLGLRVRPRRQDRAALARGSADVPGLGPLLLAPRGPGRRRGLLRRRLSEAVPGRGRSHEARLVRHRASGGPDRRPGEQRRRRRPRRGVVRARVHGPRPRISPESRRPPARPDPFEGLHRHARLPLRRRVDPLRPRDAPRASSTGTARAKRSAASWSCAPARTFSRSSKR